MILRIENVKAVEVCDVMKEGSQHRCILPISVGISFWPIKRDWLTMRAILRVEPMGLHDKAAALSRIGGVWTVRLPDARHQQAKASLHLYGEGLQLWGSNVSACGWREPGSSGRERLFRGPRPCRTGSLGRGAGSPASKRDPNGAASSGQSGASRV